MLNVAKFTAGWRSWNNGHIARVTKIMIDSNWACCYNVGVLHHVRHPLVWRAAHFSIAEPKSGSGRLVNLEQQRCAAFQLGDSQEKRFQLFSSVRYHVHIPVFNHSQQMFIWRMRLKGVTPSGLCGLKRLGMRQRKRVNPISKECRRISSD